MLAYTFKQIKTALLLVAIFTVLTGIIYPVMITGIAQLFFPWRANGSLLQHDGRIMGSVLIGQTFTDPKYCWGRPSATTPYPYNTLDSSGSNLAASNPVLLSAVRERVKRLQSADPFNQKFIPVDLVTTSASGLDPHISRLSAFYQVPRIARARGISKSEVEAIIQELENHSVCNILGEPRINVLKLNMALDHLNITARPSA